MSAPSFVTLRLADGGAVVVHVNAIITVSRSESHRDYYSEARCDVRLADRRLIVVADTLKWIETLLAGATIRAANVEGAR